MVMSQVTVIKELEAVAGFTQQDGNCLDFRDQGQHCFFIDKSLKILKDGVKYKLTIELIQDNEKDIECHTSTEN